MEILPTRVEKRYQWLAWFVFGSLVVGVGMYTVAGAALIVKTLNEPPTETLEDVNWGSLPNLQFCNLCQQAKPAFAHVSVSNVRPQGGGVPVHHHSGCLSAELSRYSPVFPTNGASQLYIDLKLAYADVDCFMFRHLDIIADGIRVTSLKPSESARHILRQSSIHMIKQRYSESGRSVTRYVVNSMEPTDVYQQANNQFVGFQNGDSIGEFDGSPESDNLTIYEALISIDSSTIKTIRIIGWPERLFNHLARASGYISIGGLIFGVIFVRKTKKLPQEIEAELLTLRGHAEVGQSVGHE